MKWIASSLCLDSSLFLYSCHIQQRGCIEGMIQLNEDHMKQVKKT